MALLPTDPRPEQAEGLPWGGCPPTPSSAFATIWATGPDTTLDGVFRVRGLRRSPEGGWESFDRFCRPFEGRDGDPATARMLREYGVSGSDLAGAPPAAEAFAGLLEFIGEGPLVVPDAQTFDAWRHHLCGSREGDAAVIGISEIASLCFPGRAPPAAKPDLGPRELQEELAALAGRFLALPQPVLRLASAGYLRAWRGLREREPELAERLGMALVLLQHPSAWAGGTGELFAQAESCDGRLGAALGSAADDPQLAVRNEIDAMQPRCATLHREWQLQAKLPPDLRAPQSPAAFDAEDMRRLDDAFQVHLPALFEASGLPRTYRAGQHQVAREVACTLGGRELLLVHAPTGTGKTLAYLVPALLWSLRHGVRVGVSTYTRALQEQAMEIEVPRALAALARTGLAERPRASLLKGRANYLCWRALRLHVPADEDPPEPWLAWTALALFAMTDDSGDLDRFPARFALTRGPAPRAQAQRAFESLVRSVRAHSGCCSLTGDRETCAADLARERAERSHVVITNHSFALARQTFFKRLVFDECEHLHEQAHAAWSHELSPRALREFLVRLRQGGRETSRAPLDRLERTVPPGTEAHRALEEATASVAAASRALERLCGALQGFKAWREEARRGRSERDEHSLLREYVLAHEELAGAGELLEAHRELASALGGLDVALASLASCLDSVPARGMPRLRRALELARTDLVESHTALLAWLPLRDGRPAFRPETFYDVEQDGRGEDVLAARVLLPNEYLGRNYYPQLSGAVMVSATTWMRGGFDSARGYLGLDRAAEPAPDEEREPCVVRCFRAPDPFDYARVVVCVPRDAPPYASARGAFRDYVRRFIAFLGERTRGRMLVLFTNADDVRRTGEELTGFFRARRIPFWYQNMPGTTKEELGQLFRSRVDSVLLGVDTFWYGADFPGETLEYLVIVKLPYGVPDRYHHAQCAALGVAEQGRRIYLPRALGKLRQGFGRLMRRESDRGAVFILDGRILQPRQRPFLAELPLAGVLARSGEDGEAAGAARFVAEDTSRCVHQALAHMDMLADVRRRGLDLEFWERELAPRPQTAAEIPEIRPEDMPF
jgi:ATP-dependent DNA helicase DinG